MRHIAMPFALLALAACGGDDEAPPLFGGFDPSAGGAVLVPPVSCYLGGLPVRLSAVAVARTDYPDVCDAVAATRAYFCGDKASSTIVFAIGVRMNVYDQAIGDAGVGTWVVTSQPTPDTYGTAEFAIAAANQGDAFCGSVPGSPLEAVGGRMTVSAAAAGGRATGSLDLTFDDGTRIADSFDDPVCPASFDFCAALNGTLDCTGATACVP